MFHLLIFRPSKKLWNNFSFRPWAFDPDQMKPFVCLSDKALSSWWYFLYTIPYKTISLTGDWVIKNYSSGMKSIYSVLIQFSFYNKKDKQWTKNRSFHRKLFYNWIAKKNHEQSFPCHVHASLMGNNLQGLTFNDWRRHKASSCNL